MVGVLQRFEHRLQGMYDGGFARAFKSDLQPTEIAGAVQREMDDRAAIVAQGRTLVPNDFVAEIAQADYDRLEVFADNLGIELATLARDHAQGAGLLVCRPGTDKVRGRAGSHHRHVPHPVWGYQGDDGRGRRDPAAGQRYPAAAGRFPRFAAAARLDRGSGRRRGALSAPSRSPRR